MKRKFRATFRGQTLVEVIIALGIVVVLAVGLISASLITQRASRTAKNNAQATKLVQQNIEQMRIYRDRRGYEAIANSPAGNGCYRLENTANPDINLWNLVSFACPQLTLYESVPLDNVNFSRRVLIANGSSSTSKLITVEVAWNESDGVHKVASNTILSKCVVNAVGC